MPFRSSFECLWCASPHTCRGSDDVEGWAMLCPDCVGRAGDNGFLRFRLRRALSDRAAGAVVLPGQADPVDPPGDLGAEMLAYYEARAPEYDDWYLRRGRYSHGPEEDAAWRSELAEARAWLEGLPVSGRIVEIAAGTGWWSTTLAQKGRLRMLDGAPGPLDIARRRLEDSGVKVDYGVRDAWAEPDEVADAVFAGFWLSHVREVRLVEFLAIARRWLAAGGEFAFIDSRADPTSGAADHPPVAEGVALRRLDDGRAFRVVKEFHSPDALRARLGSAGFTDVRIEVGRFFIRGAASART